MNQEQLNAIKERVAKATPGPWEYDNEERGIWNNGGFNYLGTVTLSHVDAEFIANAREDVPALVAEVERLRETLAFYANGNSYFVVDMYDESVIMRDKGDKARRALSGEADE